MILWKLPLLVRKRARAERNHYPALAASALDFNSIRHQAGEQTAAMAAHRGTIVLDCCLCRLLFSLSWITHYAATFLRSCAIHSEVAMNTHSNRPCAATVSIVG